MSDPYNYHYYGPGNQFVYYPTGQPQPPQSSHDGMPAGPGQQGNYASRIPPYLNQMPAHIQSYNQQMYNQQHPMVQYNPYLAYQQGQLAQSHFGHYLASLHEQTANPLRQPLPQTLLQGQTLPYGQQVPFQNQNNQFGTAGQAPPEHQHLQGYVNPFLQTRQSQSEAMPVRPMTPQQQRLQMQFNHTQLHSQVQLQHPVSLQSPVQLQSQARFQNPAQLHSPVQLKNPVQLHSPMQLQNQLQLQHREDHIENMPVLTRAITPQIHGSLPPLPTVSLTAGQAVFTPTTAKILPPIPVRKPVAEPTEVDKSTTSSDNVNCPLLEASPVVTSLASQSGLGGKLDTKTYAELAERKKAIERKFAKHFSRADPPRTEPKPEATEKKAGLEGPPSILQPLNNAVNTAPKLPSDNHIRNLQSQSFQNDRNPSHMLVKPKLASSASDDVQAKVEKRIFLTTSKHAKETVPGHSFVKENAGFGSNKENQANIRSSNHTSHSNDIAGGSSNADHPRNTILKLSRKSIEPTVLFIRPGNVNHIARESTGIVKSQKAVQPTAPRRSVAQKKRFPLLVPRSLGLEYLDSSSGEENSDQAAPLTRTLRPELNNSVVKKAHSAEASSVKASQVKASTVKAPSIKNSSVKASSVNTEHASKSSSELGISNISARDSSLMSALDNEPSFRAESSVAVPYNSRRHFAAKQPAKCEDKDPVRENVVASTLNMKPQAVDPDMHDFLVATKADLREKSAGTEVHNKSETGSSLGRYFKKSFVAASLLNKNPVSKIQIAEVKSRPGLDDDPALIHRGILRFDHEDLDRPKVPRPSSSRIRALQDEQDDRNELSYDDPVSRSHRQKLSEDALWLPPTFSGVVSKESLPPYSPPPAVSPVVNIHPPAALPITFSRKRARSEVKSTPIPSPQYEVDPDAEDTIVVDCSQLQTWPSATEPNAEEPVEKPPKKRRLIRQSDLPENESKSGTTRQVHAVKMADNPPKSKISTSSRSTAVRVAGRRAGVGTGETKPGVSTPSQAVAVSEAIRYATEEEMKSLAASIEAAQVESRAEASIDKPSSSEKSVQDIDWVPYECFICSQRCSQNNEIAKHLESRHSIILPRKFKAWQCLYPKCLKSYCDRIGALKHAKTHFRKG